MIDKKNFKEVLKKLGYTESGNVLYKEFDDIDATLKVDFKEEKLIYPEDKGFKVNGIFTTSFSQNENFVVFECVNRLFNKGYKPEHLEIEPKWQVGIGASGGRADILIKDNFGKSLLIIECKTEGREFNDAWNRTLNKPSQLFSYAQQVRSTKFVCLYTSDFIDSDIIYKSHIITLKDNEKLLLELIDKKPLSYKQAEEVEEIFQVWKETYSQDFATKGIFEDDIPAYKIGKTKYSLADLSPINNKDIQGKYNKFATILRQHNVSGRENAFDKLVNLFLCKIVDETNNPDELKFYWKGIAYDNFFELQDRLQKLYQEGMKRFLGEDVTYIDNEAIEQAFRFFKNDPDATKETIKKYFRQLKFFTNNDFSIIDVHNEKLFYQNSIVLLEIVKMLQDIKLKDEEEEHQFLGDMFEGFLDQGVKQSEGQYFTPIPIVKFILKSLPLEKIITSSDKIPKVIDYACGAGHFLNEYAKEIKPIIKQHKGTEIEKYYENVVGVEKEYRLSKVSKVSAFMYGQDDIKIVYADALATVPTIKDNEYSVLVANPPYSVKGFLETLPEIDRKKYRLISTIETKSYPNNNSIETFFIERAKQLLKPDGVAAIIVPSSILNKGNAKSTSKSTNIYVATREILLKYFDIVAIAEFGSGTFGKTGTNTVTLFIRRKKENPAPADHYENRINTWFKGDKTKNGVFEDEHFIKKYCNHVEINFDDYQTLLTGKPNDGLLETDIFKEYRKEFDKWSEIKNLKKKPGFKTLNNEDQKAELEKRFIGYIREAEKDKLYYYVLASLNQEKVLILKSPSKTAEIKKFLGYEWSSAKGNEGIQYLGGYKIDKIEDEDEDEGIEVLDKEDKRVLSNLLNLANISTPLYDPYNKNNIDKINYHIVQNFNGESFEISEELSPFLAKATLIDMLDFSRPDFNKAISLSPKNNIIIETKWPTEKLKELSLLIRGVTYSKNEQVLERTSNVILTADNITLSGQFEINKEIFLNNSIRIDDQKKLIKDDIFICLSSGSKRHLGKVAYIKENTNYYSGGFMGIIRVNEKINSKFLYELLNTVVRQSIRDTGFGTNINNLSNEIGEVKIPLPPYDIQKEIVKECQYLDVEFENARDTIEREKKNIIELYNEIYKGSLPLKSIEQLSFDIQYGINDSMNTNDSGYKIFRMNEIVQGYMYDNGSMKYVNISEEEFKKYKLNKGDILFNRTNSIEHVGKTGLFNLDGDYCYASYLIRVKVNPKKAYPEYVNFLMNSEQFQTFAKSKATKSINQANINAEKMKSIQIPIPERLIEQEKYITKYFAFKSKITEAQRIINEIVKRKEDVMKKWL